MSSKFYVNLSNSPGWCFWITLLVSRCQRIGLIQSPFPRFQSALVLGCLSVSRVPLRRKGTRETLRAYLRPMLARACQNESDRLLLNQSVILRDLLFNQIPILVWRGEAAPNKNWDFTGILFYGKPQVRICIALCRKYCTFSRKTPPLWPDHRLPQRLREFSWSGSH